MNTKKSYKILAISAFVVILIAAFVLIGKLYNLSTTVDSNISTGVAYLMISLLILSGLLNLWLIIRMTSESKTKEEYLKKTTDESAEEKEEVETTYSETQNEEEGVDINELEERILSNNDESKDTGSFAEKVLTGIANEFDIVQGLFYIRKDQSDTFSVAGKFAYYGEEEPKDFEMGKALTGQTAKNQKILNLTKIPENYITILSGLGSSSPNSLLLLPVIHENQTIGLIELASFKNFNKKTENIFSQLSEKIGEKLAERE
jgi:transcriptional regulator with GAF, ATPase, and Fis domain